MKDLKPLLVKSKEKWTGDDIAEQFNIVKKDTEFKDYVNLMGLMRSKKCNSKYAHLIPPNQRSKSRFLNINILSDWGIKVLNAPEDKNVLKEDKEQLLWVKEKENLIREMYEIMKIVKEISILLKNNWLSKKNKKKCISILKKCKTNRMKHPPRKSEQAIIKL